MASDNAAQGRAGYGPHRDPLKPAARKRTDVRAGHQPNGWLQSARFTERERVPMRIIPCPALRGKIDNYECMTLKAALEILLQVPAVVGVAEGVFSGNSAFADQLGEISV